MLAEIEAKIRELPFTAEEIAGYLEKANITGVREEGTCCPVARWLRQELTVPFVNVDIEDITVVDEEGSTYTVPTPHAVGRFTTLFDMHEEYSDLVDLDGPTDEELATIAKEIEVYEQDIKETVFV